MSQYARMERFFLSTINYKLSTINFTIPLIMQFFFMLTWFLIAWFNLQLSLFLTDIIFKQQTDFQH